MKNEMNKMGNGEGKAGLTEATLPRWAKVLIARHTEALFPSSVPHVINHCSDCGCVLISTSIARQYFSDLCPECSQRSKTTGTVPVPKIASTENQAVRTNVQSKEGANMKTLEDRSFSKTEKEIEETWQAEAETGSSAEKLFWRVRATIAKAFSRVAVYLAGSGACVYVCVHCRSVILRKVPDMPEKSVFCVPCRSEIYLRRLEKYNYAQACSC